MNQPRRRLRISALHAVVAAVAVTAWLGGPSINRSVTNPVHAQGRASAIQTAGGGKGPAAAPDANDPANAKADLSSRPPVRPLSPDEQARQFWLPAGYRLEPVLSD